MRHMLLAALLPILFGLAGPVQAQDTGNQAFERGDYAAAYAAWLPFAQQGDAAYQFNVGAVLETGEVPGKNIDDAVKWYRRAAKQGEREATLRLGEIYILGLSPAVDYGRLISPFDRLIKDNDLDALFMKAMIEERLIEVNPGLRYEAGSRALAYYRLADERGHRSAAGYIRDLESRHSKFYLGKADSFERAFRRRYWGQTE